MGAEAALSLARGTGPPMATLLVDGSRAGVEPAAFANAVIRALQSPAVLLLPEQLS